MSDIQIGGLPAAALSDPDVKTGFVGATVLPGRGAMLLQARARWPGLGEFDVLEAPPLAEAASRLDGGPDDFAGNAAFAFGGAILLPYANRITGRDAAGDRAVETLVDGRPARLPRNWGGKATGARRYAMHGLILDAAADAVEQPAPNRLHARLAVGDFGGRWPGRAAVSVTYALDGGALTLAVETHNVGDDPLPLAVGWHPYFRLPSGRREQARLRLPARTRALVNNYDEVLPTGALAQVAGGPYDFRSPRALADLYLDDCFTDLERTADGAAAAEIHDPAAGYGLRIVAPSAAVKAFQVYAPPDKPFVVVEPQFNLADPYSAVWPAGVDTGMARLAPGETALYVARLELFAPVQG